MWVSLAAIVAVCFMIGLRLVALQGGGASPEVAAAVPMAAQEPSKKAAEPAKEPAAGEAKGSKDAVYAVNKPATTFKLPDTLNEISGLALASDGESVWGMHDERGTLYRIGIKDGKVLAEVPFGPAGDYEGIEAIGDRVYVARSSGTLMVVDETSGKTNELNFKSQLGKKCDVEGLGFQEKENRLLLSCKSPTPETRKIDEKVFEVFALDLGTKKLGDKAAYTITAAAMDKFVADHPKQADIQKIKGKNFGASGLAVHPTSGEIYIVSSMGEVMLILDPESGDIIGMQRLEREIHAQPEGIAFSKDGTMFLSDEGRGKTATLHVIKAPVVPES